MKILITGVTGTGKSTISQALKDRNIFSVDFSEIPDLCVWRNKQTKDKVDYFPINDKIFFDLNERICDVKMLKEVLDKYEDIVVTGITKGNQTEYLSLFDKVILLQCSPETIIHRLETRTAPFGKTKVEQDFAMDWQKNFDPLLLSYGAMPINTEGNLDAVVNEIIEQI